jgi:VCBS repeat-containing protein
VNDIPTNTVLTNNSIAENAEANAVIGSLTTTDPDVADSFTYSLQTSGCGGTYADSSAFNIDGSSLRATNSFNYETKNSYSICIRTTDAASLSFDKSFTIAVTNVDEPNTAPTLNAIASGTLSEVPLSKNVTSSGIAGTVSGADAENDTLTYRIQGGGLASNGLWYKAGKYGTLLLNNTTGAYEYRLAYSKTTEDPLIEPLTAGAIDGESFAIEAFDGSVASTSRNFQITMYGAAEMTPVCSGADGLYINSKTTGSEVTGQAAEFTVTRCAADQANQRNFSYGISLTGSGFGFSLPAGAGCVTGRCTGTFEAGALTATISVPIINNGIYTNQNQLNVKLYSSEYLGLTTASLKYSSASQTVTEATAAPTATPDLTVSPKNVYAYRRAADFIANSATTISKTIYKSLYIPGYAGYGVSTTAGGSATFNIDYNCLPDSSCDIPNGQLSAPTMVISKNLKILANNAETATKSFEFAYSANEGNFVGGNTTKVWIKPYSPSGIRFNASTETAPYSVWSGDFDDILLASDSVRADVLDGGNGNDWLEGGVSMVGMNGNDTLVAGNLTTTMNAGADADTYVFQNLSLSTIAKPITVVNFITGTDKFAVPPASTPTRVWKVPTIYAASLTAAAEAAFADKDGLTPGNQPLEAGEAAIFPFCVLGVECNTTNLKSYFVIASGNSFDANTFILRLPQNSTYPYDVPGLATGGTYFTTLPTRP